MRSHTLSRLTDRARFLDQIALIRRDREKAAGLLACLAEMDARESYLPTGHASTYHYCVEELQMDGDDALRHVQAARSARRFPSIFAAVADGRLQLGAVALLAPYLTADNADDLLGAATDKTEQQVEALLVARCPQLDFARRAWALAVATKTAGRGPAVRPVASPTGLHAPEQVGSIARPHAPGPVEPDAPRAEIAPLAPDQIALQVILNRETYDRLRYVQALLGHDAASNDIAAVLEEALNALLRRELE